MIWDYFRYDKEKELEETKRMMEINRRIEYSVRQEQQRLQQEQINLQKERARLVQERKHLQEEEARLVQERKNLQEEEARLTQERKQLHMEQKHPESRDRANRNMDERKKQMQAELAECSRRIREMQKDMKELYHFEPCRQLCELEVNLEQGVYHDISHIKEDLEYIMEEFGISEFEVQPGMPFDARYHTQVDSQVKDARGRKIDKVHSKGFQVDGEVIWKAHVSVQ